METLTQNPVNLKNEAFKNGFILTGVNLVLFLVTNYVLPEMMGSMFLNILTFVIGIALAIFFCLDMRKKAGGYWTFSEALTNIFIMFLISAGFMYVFNIIFGKYIDPTYPVRMKEIILNSTMEMVTKMGVDDVKLEEMREVQSQKLDKQFNPSFFEGIVGFGIQAIFYVVGAVIFAAIFKKTKPLFPQNVD